METKQVEGFKLMIYECEKCRFSETIWNSRDAVTPFMIRCTHCEKGSMKHIAWKRDFYSPDHKPKKGDRIFVNLTMDRAIEIRKKYVDYFWDDKRGGDVTMGSVYKDKDFAVQTLAKSDFESFGAGTTPDLITVQEDW